MLGKKHSAGIKTILRANTHDVSSYTNVQECFREILNKMMATTKQPWNDFSNVPEENLKVNARSQQFVLIDLSYEPNSGAKIEAHGAHMCSRANQQRALFKFGIN